MAVRGMPERIGAYRIERLLGVGSFATVWLGHDPALDARVAIKVLAENWSHDLRVRERFQQEARLLWQLDDDRVVRVHTLGELLDGRPYAVMAWADGGSLRDLLAAGPLPVAVALELLRDLATAVAVLHRARIVHRDLTPGNVLFRSDRPHDPRLPGRLLVADLGLAKALAAASGLTARAGTPGFMAPEQDDPLSQVDTRADVYGLGRIGLLLLGQGGGSAELRPGVPAAVGLVLRQATAQVPGDRPADATAFGAALTEARNRSHPARGWSRTPARSRSGALARGWSGPPARGWSEALARGWSGPPARGWLAAAVLLICGIAADSPAVHGAETARAGRLSVILPPGWRHTGSGWSGRRDARGVPEPAMIVSPDPERWPDDPTMPGAFVGLITTSGTAAGSTAAPGSVAGSPTAPGTVAGSTSAPGSVTGPTSAPGTVTGSAAASGAAASFVAQRPHAPCEAAPARRTTRAGIDWVVARFTCPAGKPVIVEAAGAHGEDLVYVQVGAGPELTESTVDALLAGVKVR